MSSVRIGIVGVGHIARRAHLPALQPLLEAGEAELVAFCDTDEAALREAGAEYGVDTLYTDHHLLIEREELDALYLLIPPTCHTDTELIAAERGIALFVEKPQTLDFSQAREFDAAIRKAGIVSQVGFMTRYYPAAERAREILAERIPRHASVQLFTTHPPAPLRYWTSRWELCGGSFVENSIHMVDFLRFLYGDIERVSAFYLDRHPQEQEDEPMDMPHAYAVNFRFAGGTLANVTTARCLTNARMTRREVLLVSNDSLIEWSPRRMLENGQVLWESSNPGNPFALQAAAFIRAVRDGDPGAVRSPYPEALNSLEAVLAANDSARADGMPVAVR